MTQSDYIDLLALADRIFPDGSPLAVFMLLTEIRAGLLGATTLKGDDALRTRDDAPIAAITGVVLLQEGPRYVQWWSHGAIEKDAIEQAVELVRALPATHVDGPPPQMAPPGRSLVAIATLLAPEGDRSIVLFRHRTLDHPRALHLAQTLYNLAKDGTPGDDAEEPPAGSSPN